MKYVHINYVSSSFELMFLSVDLSECLALTSYFEDYSKFQEDQFSKKYISVKRKTDLHNFLCFFHTLASSPILTVVYIDPKHQTKPGLRNWA